MLTTRSALAALLALVLGVVLPHPVEAAEDPQAIDVSALRPYRGWEVAEIVVEGLPEDLGGVEGGLALKPRRKFLSIRRPVIDLVTAGDDARRLRLLLAQNGFPRAIVVATGEVSDAEAQRVAVTFTVDPGQQVSYGEIAVEGIPDAAQAVADSAQIALPQDGRFDEEAVLAVRDDLILGMRRAGHPRAEIELKVELADSSRADVLFDCEPGTTFTYEGLQVTGAPPDLEPLARRTIDLEAGTPYSPVVAADSRQYLRDLDLFRQIRLKNEPQDSTTLDLVAELSPRKMLTLETSVGTFTDNPVVVTAYAVHRNIFKGGRGLGAGASYATHYRWAEVRTWWHAALFRRTRTTLRLRYDVEDEDSYRLGTASITLSTLYNLWRFSSLRTAITVSNGVLDNRSSDPDAFIDEVGLQTVFSLMWFRDTSDNPLNPLTGSRMTVQTDWSIPKVLTDNPFGSFRAYGSRYIHLGGENVIALRLDAGYAWPLGDALDLTPNRRWYAGGASSMRGYQRRRLGPQDSEGNPIGGELRLLAGGEYRMPLTSLLGLAFFLDTGQVWATPEDFSFRRYQAAVGAGLLIKTPVGPIRFDFAHIVTEPVNDESRWQLHFAIGHPY
jgi:outer membrane translocation and assembly module TamA